MKRKYLQVDEKSQSTTRKKLKLDVEFATTPNNITRSLQLLPDEVIGEIVLFMQTCDWISFSYTCKQVNELKYSKHLMFDKVRTVQQRMSQVDIIKYMTLSQKTLFAVCFIGSSRILEKVCHLLRGVIQKLLLFSPSDYALSKDQVACLEGVKYLHMNLEEFSLYREFGAYCNLRSIETLILCNVRVSDRDFQNFTQLQTLAFMFGTGVTDGSFQYLTKAKSIMCMDSDITDRAISHLQGSITELDVSRCRRLTTDAFKYLQGTIRKLILDGCNQISITDEALKYIQGSIQILSLWRCTQFTDRGLSYLKGSITELDISYCTQFTDSGFACLKGTIKKLIIRNCTQITSEAFSHLQGTIEELNMSNCQRITDDAFQYLHGTIKRLDMSGCLSITDKAFPYLQGSIRKLNVSQCEKITDQAFIHIRDTILELDISFCTQLTDETFRFLSQSSIGKLSMEMCRQNTITNKAFSYIQPTIKTLNITECHQLTDEAFQYLTGVECLNMLDCRQSTITDKAFKWLHSIRKLKMNGCNTTTISNEAYEYLSRTNIKRIMMHIGPSHEGYEEARNYFATNVHIS